MFASPEISIKKLTPVQTRINDEIGVGCYLGEEFFAATSEKRDR